MRWRHGWAGLLAMIAALPASGAVAPDRALEIVVEREAGHVLDGTLFQVDRPSAPGALLSIGIQNVVQSGMPSYTELLTVHVRTESPPVWQDMGKPFADGHFVWLVVLDGRLVAIDRQDIAPPRLLAAVSPPHWRELDAGERKALERHLRREGSKLRRPRMRTGDLSVQVLDAGLVELCRYGTAEAPDCASRKLPSNSDMIYSIGEHADGTVLFANSGWVRIDPNGEPVSAWSSDPRGESNQVYTALRAGNQVLLGHYPSGNVLRMSLAGDKVRTTAAFRKSPYTAPASRDEREAQSLAHYAGRIYTGVWPWGELYRTDGAGAWALSRRLFSAPAISKSHAPYTDDVIDGIRNPSRWTRWSLRLRELVTGRAEEKPDKAEGNGDADVWGQRVTQLVPLGPSLYVATGNKGGEYVPFWLRLLPDPDQAREYGRVHRLTIPGNLACSLPPAARTLRLGFAVRGGRLEVSADGKPLCSLADSSAAFAATRLVAHGHVGDGIFGSLRGGTARLATESPRTAGSTAAHVADR